MDRTLISATDEEIEARFDALGYCAAVDDLVIEHGTVADWLAARSEWSDGGRLLDSGDDYAVIADARAFKGQPRRTVVVVQYPDGIVAVLAI